MASPRRRLFVDINVFFSGLYSHSAPPAALLALHAQGHVTIVVSDHVLVELLRTIRRVKPDLLPLLREFLEGAPPEVAADPTPAEIRAAEACINELDAPILAAAKKSGADCLVTGNTRHFTKRVAECAGIAISTPRQYLDQLAR